MDKKPQNIINIGRLGSAHGIHGWLKVHSFTEPVENILTYQPWYLKIKGTWQVQVAGAIDLQVKGNMLLAKMPGINNREEARLYTNIEIGIAHSQLPALAEGEYYWTDLVGIDVVNQDNIVLGKVTQVFDTGSNDVLVIQNDSGKQHLVPYIHDEYIISVDMAAKRIVVNWDPEF